MNVFMIFRVAVRAIWRNKTRSALTMLGIIFGIIYYKTGNILVTALLHIINNSTAALQMCLFGEDFDSISYADLLGGDTAASATMALCAMLSILHMALFWNNYPSSKKV